MKELEILKSLWDVKTKTGRRKSVREPTLIVPHIDTKNSRDDFCHENWFFNVSYAFREALDIKYEERKKDKKSYWLWTQGPYLSFKDGDTLRSRDNKIALQVKYANSMGWDTVKQEMYQGSIVFDKFNVDGHKHTPVSQHSCNEMEFL